MTNRTQRLLQEEVAVNALGIPREPTAADPRMVTPNQGSFLLSDEKRQWLTQFIILYPASHQLEPVREQPVGWCVEMEDHQTP